MLSDLVNVLINALRPCDLGPHCITLPPICQAPGDTLKTATAL